MVNLLDILLCRVVIIMIMARRMGWKRGTWILAERERGRGRWIERDKER